MNKDKYIVFGVLLALLAGYGIWLIARPHNTYANLEQFAQCLRDKGAVMYGASWCSHCQNEKKKFGDSFKYVPYVECTTDAKKCTDAGVQSYPTWVFSDGRRFMGEQGLENLSRESGCELVLEQKK